MSQPTIDAPSAVIDGIEIIDPEFFLYLPCSTGAVVFAHFMSRPSVTAFPITKEEEGVGILAGLSLAGRRAVMMIQDTGLGNALTVLTTFPRAYHVPMFILATRTGGAGEINSAVSVYSDRLPQVLTAAGIYHEVLDHRIPRATWAGRIGQLDRYARVSHQPVVVLADMKRLP